jgi:hypothetical protein
MRPVFQPHGALAEILAREQADRPFGSSFGEMVMPAREPPPSAPPPFVVPPPPWSTACVGDEPMPVEPVPVEAESLQPLERPQVPTPDWNMGASEPDDLEQPPSPRPAKRRRKSRTPNLDAIRAALRDQEGR